MRQRWLTDTSISPAICLTEGGERLRVPHAWRREHCLLVRGDRERGGGVGRGGWRGEREIASSQFQFDEGHSVSSGWAEIYVTLAWLRLQKRTVKMCRDLKSSAHAILQLHRAGLPLLMGPYIPFWWKTNPVLCQQQPIFVVDLHIELLPIYEKVFNNFRDCTKIIKGGRGIRKYFIHLFILFFVSPNLYFLYFSLPYSYIRHNYSPVSVYQFYYAHYIDS